MRIPLPFQGWEYQLRSHSAAGRLRARRPWPSRQEDQCCRGPRWTDPRPPNWRSPDPDPKEPESADPARRGPEQGTAPLPRRRGSRLRDGSIWLSSASLAWRGSRLPPSDCKGWPQSPAGVTLNHGMPLRRGFCPSPFGALNSAVECHLHTVEVAGSNPAAPTIESITYGHNSRKIQPAAQPKATAVLRGFRVLWQMVAKWSSRNACALEDG